MNENTNPVAKTLTYFHCIVFIIGIVASVIFAESWQITILYWFISIVSAAILIGLAEIIKLLSKG